MSLRTILKVVALDWLFVAIVLAILLTPSAAETGNTPRVPVVHDSVVSVNGICSGFVAAPGLVVTAAHCVARSPLVRVIFRDLSVGFFKVVRSGKSATTDDLAILKGPTLQWPSLQLSPKRVEKYRLARHFRFIPHELVQKMLVVLTGRELCEPENGCWLTIIGNIQGGDSGGAVVDPETNLVVGMVTMSYDQAPLALAIYSDEILKELKKFR